MFKAVVVGMMFVEVFGVAYGQELGTAPGLAAGDALREVQGVTFDSHRGKVYVPVREIGSALGVYVGWDDATRTISFNEVALPEGSLKKLYDETNLVDISSLKKIGYQVSQTTSKDIFSVATDKVTVLVTVPAKWVEISLGDQRLTAWQGERLVMDTNVSTGRKGFRTPTGEFTAGPEKARMRYSRKYDNAPMPYAVQIHGGYFVHGYGSVPSYPASHGCIRMPLGKKNAAKYFFEWVTLGTPVAIRSDWSAKTLELMKGDESDASDD